MNTLPLRRTRSALAAAALCLSVLAAHAAPAQPTQAAPATSGNGGLTAPALAAPAAVDIRDIRGPKPIPSLWSIPLVAMTALVAMGGAYGTWVWNRRRFQEASKRPLDIALERLDQARERMSPQGAREFSMEVSSAVRDYIENRFDLRAAHLTTDEFLHQLLEPADSLLTAHRTLLHGFLQTCDLAKFGGWQLAVTDMEAMLQSARRFIVESAADGGSHRVPPAAAPSQQPSDTVSRETYVSLPST